MPASLPGNRSSVGVVASASVGGAAIKRHVLEVETERMMHLVRKVGLRLRTWLRTMPETRVAMRYDREAFCHYPILDENGKQLTEPLLPDRDWLENAEWYQKTMLGLLREQRERAKLTPKNGAPVIDDETFERELAELAKQTIRAMSKEERRALVEECERAMSGSHQEQMQTVRPVLV